MEMKLKKGTLTITEKQTNRLLCLLILVLCSMGSIASISVIGSETFSMKMGVILLIFNIIGVVINFCFLAKQFVTYKEFENEKTKKETKTPVS